MSLQVKFRLSAEEAEVVQRAVSAEESLAAFAKRACLALASGGKEPTRSAPVEVSPEDLSDRVALEQSELERRLDELKGQARPGVRVAMVCPRCAADGAPRRNFGDLDWKCPEHGVAVRQENRPYLGVSTV